MELREAVKAILKKQDKTQKWLAEELGYSSRGVLNDTLSRGNIRLSTLIRICEKLGGEVAMIYQGVKYTLEEKKK